MYVQLYVWHCFEYVYVHAAPCTPAVYWLNTGSSHGVKKSQSRQIEDGGAGYETAEWSGEKGV